MLVHNKNPIGGADDFVGSYKHTFESGKVYIGKGTGNRPAISGKQLENLHNDKLVNTELFPTGSHADAFMDEARMIREYQGGVKNTMLYNKINSPGEKMLINAGE